MPIVVLAWMVGVIAISAWLYRATKFDYLVANGTLEAKCKWIGMFPITKRFQLSNIESARKLKSTVEVIPLISGTLPTLWGKFQPSKMLIIKRRGRGFFPLIITPDNPEELLSQIEGEQNAR
jgi:hypothetical protein